MAEKLFTLDEIRAAFWAEFNGAGEIWFPDPDRHENAEDFITAQWGQFCENLAGFEGD